MKWKEVPLVDGETKATETRDVTRRLRRYKKTKPWE